MAANRDGSASTAERAGISDQQDAELEKMGEEGSRRTEPESTPDREGIVDQQGALIEKEPPRP
jgi:hypothetical protein